MASTPPWSDGTSSTLWRVYGECLPLLRDIGENLMADHAIWGLGKLALREGRLEEAQSCAARSLLFQIGLSEIFQGSALSLTRDATVQSDMTALN